MKWPPPGAVVLHLPRVLNKWVLFPAAQSPGHLKLNLKIDLPGKAVQSRATLSATVLRNAQTIALDAVNFQVTGCQWQGEGAMQATTLPFRHEKGKLTLTPAGGFKAGTAFGATDELGYYAVDQPLTVYDFWATILHQLGLDHEKLTYRFGGRDFRLTDVHGQVIKPILA